MKPRHQKNYQTRAARQRRDFWKRFGVWIFIAFFALGTAGATIAVVSLSSGK